MKNIAILGAGITGLAAAYFIQKRFGAQVSCTLFEASPTVGGWLATEKENGALFELGPRSLRAASEPFLQLLQELGLEPVYATQEAKKRYIAQGGVLQALPSNAVELFTTKLGRMLLVACIRNVFSSKKMFDDESVASYFTHRIGRHACDMFISALTNGIYAASPEELSMRSCFSSIWQKGSLFLPAARSFSFSEGIAMLPQAIFERLSATVHLNCPVHAIEEHADRVMVDLHAFDHLISTIQPSKLSALLPKQDPVISVPTTSLAALSFGYMALQDIPEGFGFLCTQAEDANLLGIVFDSNLFPSHNGMYKTRLSIMLGGTKNPEMLSYSDEVLVAFAKEAVKKYLKIEQAPDFVRITRAQDAISRYPVGHYRTVEALGQQKRRITLLGSGLTGVSVGDCITSAHEYVYKKLGETLMSA